MFACPPLQSNLIRLLNKSYRKFRLINPRRAFRCFSIMGHGMGQTNRSANLSNNSLPKNAKKSGNLAVSGQIWQIYPSWIQCTVLCRRGALFGGFCSNLQGHCGQKRQNTICLSNRIILRNEQNSLIPRLFQWSVPDCSHHTLTVLPCCGRYLASRRSIS